jgi:hypothetical protein
MNRVEGEPLPASENGPYGSSEEAGEGLGGLRRRGAAATLGRSRQGVPRASYARDNKADRPVRYPRLDLEQERGSRPCAWSNSNR